MHLERSGNIWLGHLVSFGDPIMDTWVRNNGVCHHYVHNTLVVDVILRGWLLYLWPYQPTKENRSYAVDSHYRKGKTESNNWIMTTTSIIFSGSSMRPLVSFFFISFRVSFINWVARSISSPYQKPGVLQKPENIEVINIIHISWRWSTRLWWSLGFPRIWPGLFVSPSAWLSSSLCLHNMYIIAENRGKSARRRWNQKAEGTRGCCQTERYVPVAS